MANENDSSKVFYPMIPESNWWSIRNQFKKTLPSTVTTNYLKSLLALTTDQAARNLISPLKVMGIIAEDGTPTALANDWRNDSKYPQVCVNIIDEVYPRELLDLFPGNEVDKQRVIEWFMSTAQLGESAAKKVASLFILLKDATVKTDLSSASTVQKPKGLKKAKNVEGKKEAGVIQPEEKLLSQQATHSAKKDVSMHIDLQIHISPDASADQIDAIFASMAKHLYK